MYRLPILMILFVPATAARAQGRHGDAETFFELKIRPVLADKCFKCHGGKKVSQGLRVDSRAALLKGGESGPALIPGDADKSLLIQALRYAHADIKMPPDKQLPDKVVADFAAWVQQGAACPATSPRSFGPQKHWAFEPVRPHAVPVTESRGESPNPVAPF